MVLVTVVAAVSISEVICSTSVAATVRAPVCTSVSFSVIPFEPLLAALKIIRTQDLFSVQRYDGAGDSVITDAKRVPTRRLSDRERLFHRSWPARSPRVRLWTENHGATIEHTFWILRT
jgi:hypothetical protein